MKTFLNILIMRMIQIIAMLKEKITNANMKTYPYMPKIYSIYIKECDKNDNSIIYDGRWVKENNEKTMFDYQDAKDYVKALMDCYICGDKNIKTYIQIIKKGGKVVNEFVTEFEEYCDNYIKCNCEECKNISHGMR